MSDSTDDQLAVIAAALREAGKLCEDDCADPVACDAAHPIQATLLTFDQVTHLEGPVDAIAEVVADAVHPELDRLRAEVERLKAANDRAWDVVQLVRFRAIACAEDPYGDPVGQLMSAALIGVPSHEEVRAELRELEPKVQRRIYGPLADGAAGA